MSLEHFLHSVEALTSPQEWQPHGWTLQSIANLLFAKGAPRRKQKNHDLASAQDGSLTAVQQWAELCMTACNPPFLADKQSAHSGSAGCLPHLQLTALLFNGPGGKISEKGDTPLVWVPSETEGCKKEKFCDLWLCCPMSGVSLFLFRKVETSSSIKWDVLTFCVDRLSLQIG